MPQQFLRSKRNNLRFVNNYKRDHFTQDSSTQKGVFIKDLKFMVNILSQTQRTEVRTDYGGTQGQEKNTSYPATLVQLNVNSGTHFGTEEIIDSKDSDLGETKVSLNESGNKITLEHVWKSGTTLQDNALYTAGTKNEKKWTRYNLYFIKQPPDTTKVGPWKWTLDVPAKPVDGTDVEFVVDNDRTPRLKFNTEGTFYVENNGKDEKIDAPTVKTLDLGTKKVKISRQNEFIRSESLTLKNPDAERVEFEWNARIGGSGSITNCAHVNSARNMLGLGSDFDCPVDNFTQRPDNFPQSKVDDFSQDWEALLTKFDSDLDAIGSGIGSYTSSRDDILQDILTAVQAGDYRGVQLITDMSKGLYAAAESIEAKVNALEQIKRDFNDISSSGLGKYDSLRTKARAGMN